MDCKSKIFKGGHHFSYLGGSERIIDKLNAFAHQELNVPGIDAVRLQAGIDVGQPLGTSNPEERYSFCEIDETYPKYIVDNQHTTLKHLINWRR
jgi:beta-1,4-mannosyl-glycoprotein beta-1,4-N-acetylglucosaminyltransferase